MRLLERTAEGGTRLTEMGQRAAANPPPDLGLDPDGLPAPPVDYKGGMLDLLDLWHGRPTDPEQLAVWLDQRWNTRMVSTSEILGRSVQPE
jgi:hypothetical protein